MMPSSKDHISDDTYEHPTPQIVYVHGRQCVETISLPNLQQYYQNVPRLNKDYGYFKLIYFDFPLNDSIPQIIGASAQISVSVNVWFSPQLHPWDPEHGGNQVKNTTTINTIDLAGIHNCYDMAQKIKQMLMNTIPYNEDGIDPESANFHLFQWIDDFAFEPSTSKYIVEFSAPGTIVDAGIYPGEGLKSYIKRIAIVFEGGQKDQTGALLAQLFGGAVVENGWISTVDTGFTQFFSNARHKKDDANYDPANKLDSFIASTLLNPQMYIDQHVYIRGTPEASMWTTDGQNTDVISICARNRPAGVISPQQAFLADQNYATKTSMSSLRNMTLRFTDKNNNLLRIDEPYTVKIALGFNV